MYFTSEIDSPIGKLVLGSDWEHLIGLWMGEQKYIETTMPKQMQPDSGLAVLEQGKAWLRAYFAKERPDPRELPLAPIGGEFRRCVWELLLEIPYGELTTYGELATEAAKRLGRRRMSAQAVGGAVGHNPLGIIIPCHRVVGKDGCLTGYAGGMDKKMWLLEHEGVDMAKLYLPKKHAFY